MPDVKIYIRAEDIDTWNSIEKKAEFIHKALNKEEGEISGMKIDNSTSYGVPTEKFVPRAPDPETGYPCCLKARPCKHWVWDGNRSAYINSLTGKEREAVL